MACINEWADTTVGTGLLFYHVVVMLIGHSLMLLDLKLLGVTALMPTKASLGAPTSVTTSGCTGQLYLQPRTLSLLKPCNMSVLGCSGSCKGAWWILRQAASNLTASPWSSIQWCAAEESNLTQCLVPEHC